MSIKQAEDLDIPLREVSLSHVISLYVSFVMYGSHCSHRTLAVSCYPRMSADNVTTPFDEWHENGASSYEKDVKVVASRTALSKSDVAAAWRGRRRLGSATQTGLSHYSTRKGGNQRG